MKLTRYDGHVPLFSQNMEGRERTLFGSTVQDDDINNQFTPEFLRGWGSVGSTEFPTLQDFNALAYTHNKLLSYLYQAGIPSYTQNEEYYIGSIVQYNKDIYICLRDNPTVLPTDTNAWKRLINISDMSQEVINNDLLTVTSGAVYRALQPKADSTYVNTELNKKANLTYVNTELGKKADKTYVDSELGKKANKTYVDTELNKKANLNYVNTELGKKITGGNVVQTTGQSTVDVMSQKGVAEQLIAVNKDLIDVSGNRLANVSYQNPHDRAQLIYLYLAARSDNKSIVISKDNQNWIFAGGTSSSGGQSTVVILPSKWWIRVLAKPERWSEM